MEILRFYKEKTGKWYADIPEWTGKKSALQMVAGADTLLEHLTANQYNTEKDVYIYFTEEEHVGSNCIMKVRNCLFNGANYKIKTLENKEINLKLWLCNVTKFVFGYFPEKIYISKVIF